MVSIRVGGSLWIVVGWVVVMAVGGWMDTYNGLRIGATTYTLSLAVSRHLQ